MQRRPLREALVCESARVDDKNDPRLTYQQESVR